MALVKLFNRGKSEIHFAAGKVFLPGTAGAFSEDQAKVLIRLYPQTVQSVEEMTKVFSTDVTDFQEPEAEVAAAPKAKAKADDTQKAAV